MTWKVTSGAMVIEQVGSSVVVNDAAAKHLASIDRTAFDDVFFPPVVAYESKGEGDTTAAFLNATLYLPDADVTGIPPVELEWTDVIVDGKEDNNIVEAKALPPSYRRPRAPGEDMNTGGMIALIPDAESAAKLAIPGGDPQSELHLTMYFMASGLLLNEAQRDVIRSIIQLGVVVDGYEVEAQVVGTGTLGDQDAKVYLIGDAFMLTIMFDNVRRAMSDAVELTRGEYTAQRAPWIAHVTAGYGDAVDLSKMTYRGPIKFDRVRVALGDTYTDFSLSKSDWLAEDALEWLKDNAMDVEVSADNAPPMPMRMKDLFDGMAPDLAVAAADLSAKDIAEEMFAKEGSPNPNAARLRAYWTRGEGAAKIRWGVHGDFMRCVRHMSKYVKDPKGTCANYHKTAIGVWPGREKSLPPPLNLQWADSEVLEHVKRLTFGTPDHPDTLSGNESEGTF